MGTVAGHCDFLMSARVAKIRLWGLEGVFLVFNSYLDHCCWLSLRIADTHPFCSPTSVRCLIWICWKALLTWRRLCVTLSFIRRPLRPPVNSALCKWIVCVYIYIYICLGAFSSHVRLTPASANIPKIYMSVCILCLCVSVFRFCISFLLSIYYSSPLLPSIRACHWECRKGSITRILVVQHASFHMY